jgi:hypothetical protein
MCAFGPHTSSNTTVPLVSCTVNNALFHTVPNFGSTLFGTVYIRSSVRHMKIFVYLLSVFSSLTFIFQVQHLKVLT